jgi:hypothetical protein
MFRFIYKSSSSAYNTVVTSIQHEYIALDTAGEVLQYMNPRNDHRKTSQAKKPK